MLKRVREISRGDGAGTASKVTFGSKTLGMDRFRSPSPSASKTTRLLFSRGGELWGGELPGRTVSIIARTKSEASDVARMQSHESSPGRKGNTLQRSESHNLSNSQGSEIQVVRSESRVSKKSSKRSESARATRQSSRSGLKRGASSSGIHRSVTVNEEGVRGLASIVARSRSAAAFEGVRDSSALKVEVSMESGVTVTTSRSSHSTRDVVFGEYSLRDEESTPEARTKAPRVGRKSGGGRRDKRKSAAMTIDDDGNIVPVSRIEGPLAADSSSATLETVDGEATASDSDGSEFDDGSEEEEDSEDDDSEEESESDSDSELDEVGGFAIDEVGSGAMGSMGGMTEVSERPLEMQVWIMQSTLRPFMLENCRPREVFSSNGKLLERIWGSIFCPLCCEAP